MFDKLKKFVSTLGYAWQYGDVIRNTATAWSKFPGWDDPELLRIWIRPLIQDAAVLTTLTKTPIDDIITTAAIKIVDHNSSWSAVYALAQLVRDGFANEGTLIPNDRQNNISIEQIATTACPECPAVGLTALGILLFLLQHRK
ncbi:MAG: hypothetical protein LBE18_12160 [Planctomycetaceae bacterium]|jgi:hypothetical protein|nr:hypothetical protein [Planctomycetaceae bacterium]